MAYGTSDVKLICSLLLKCAKSEVHLSFGPFCLKATENILQRDYSVTQTRAMSNQADPRQGRFFFNLKQMNVTIHKETS